MQKDFLHVLPVEEVISRLLDVSPLPQESKRLDKLSGGPILAETIMATETLPPANRSGMDGYAVQASDLFGASEANPVWLDCVGEIAIDRPPNFTLQSGQCAAIVTGGYLPEGADAVIMVEHTKPFGAGVIEMRRSVAPGEYVMQKGDDAQEGTPLLERGTKLRAQEIGLLAALGITEVPVIRRPRVSILSTGDELVSPEQTPRPRPDPRRQHTRPFSHAPSGCRCLHIRHRAGSARTADGFPQSGPGRRKRPFGGCRLPVRRKLHRRPDLTLEALQSLGDTEILCHGVALSPGKPLILARCGQTLVWGLPGQVASAQVVMHVLGVPFLRHLAGHSLMAQFFGQGNFRYGHAFDQTFWPSRQAILSRNIASRQGREDYIRVRLEHQANGLPRAVPVPGLSGLLRTLLDSEGLVRISARIEGLEAGTPVDVLLFES